MALGIAVAVSLLLMGATALFVRFSGGPDEKAPPQAALPGVYIPPPLSEAESSAPAPTTAQPAVPVSTPRTTVPTEGRKDKPSAKPSASTSHPVTPALSVSRAAVPARVDLSAQGRRDWIHWGLSAPESVDRRSGGTGEIKDLAVSAPVNRYDNNPQAFSWTGGTPTASTGPSPTGLYVCQAGGSFAVSVTAAPAIRTLHLYAGVWMAEGRLTATLAGRTVTAALENRETNGNAVFVLKFRAPAGETLRVTWLNAVQHHPTCGNVNVQAAALS